MTFAGLRTASREFRSQLHGFMPFTARLLSPAQVNASAVAARVADLVACLVADEPGLTCPLAAGLMSAFGPAERYVGVLRSPSRDSQNPDPAVKGNLARFLWNHMASVSARVRDTPASWFPADTCAWLAQLSLHGMASTSCPRCTISQCLSGSLALLY